MTISETPEQVVATGFRLSWGPIIAGAIAAAALAFVLNSFGLAIGLAISSASPAWRDTSFALVLLSGLYLVLVALASYGLGGYIAGRMQRRFDATEFPEFQDGMHGIIVWGIATLLAGDSRGSEPAAVISHARRCGGYTQCDSFGSGRESHCL